MSSVTLPAAKLPSSRCRCDLHSGNCAQACAASMCSIAHASRSACWRSQPIGSLSASLEPGSRARPHHPGQRPVVPSRHTASPAHRNAPFLSDKATSSTAHHARHGAHQRRAHRRWSSSRRWMRPIRCTGNGCARSGDLASAGCSRAPATRVRCRRFDPRRCNGFAALTCTPGARVTIGDAHSPRRGVARHVAVGPTQARRRPVTDRVCWSARAPRATGLLAGRPGPLAYRFAPVTFASGSGGAGSPPRLRRLRGSGWRSAATRQRLCRAGPGVRRFTRKCSRWSD